MHGAESGGAQSAKLLKSATSKYVAKHRRSGQADQIEARVYADLKGLSIEIVQQSGLHYKPTFPRALGGFAAGFSREYDFFDFVDVVDEEAVESKITSTFQL